MAAVGQIIDEASLTLFMGSINLALQSNQDKTGDGSINSPTIQQFIDMAEARVKSKLALWFAIPLTVGGVALKSATGSIALPLLQMPAHQYVCFALNKWRALQSVPSMDEEGGPQAINYMARGWERNADYQLAQILRYAEGYSDGDYVDLDLAPGAIIGQQKQTVRGPIFAGRGVGYPGVTCAPAEPWWTCGLPYLIV